MRILIERCASAAAVAIAFKCSRRRAAATRTVTPNPSLLWFLLLAVAIGWSISTVQSTAQTFPDRALKIVVPFAPGGGIDFVGRALGQRLEIELKQSVVIENRTSGGSTVGVASVANAPTDGYTLLVVDPSVTINPSLRQNSPYQLKQLKVLATLTTAPLMVVVHPQLPIHSLKEMIEYSKVAPGGMTYGSAGIGTTTHLAPELLKVQTGFNATHIPYRGGGPSIPDLLSGRIQSVFYSNATVLPLMNDGRVRAVAQTGPQRIKASPTVPTAKEAGYPDFVVELWTAVFVPVGLPADVEKRLEDAIKRIAESPEFIAAIQIGGLESFYKPGPTAASFVQAEYDRWSSLIKTANITEN